MYVYPIPNHFSFYSSILYAIRVRACAGVRATCMYNNRLFYYCPFQFLVCDTRKVHFNKLKFMDISEQQQQKQVCEFWKLKCNLIFFFPIYIYIFRIRKNVSISANICIVFFS